MWTNTLKTTVSQHWFLLLVFVLFYAIHETFGNMCLFLQRLLDVPERRQLTQQRPHPLQQRSHLCTDLSPPFLLHTHIHTRTHAHTHTHAHAHAHTYMQTISYLTPKAKAIQWRWWWWWWWRWWWWPGRQDEEGWRCGTRCQMGGRGGGKAPRLGAYPVGLSLLAQGHLVNARMLNRGTLVMVVMVSLIVFYLPHKGPLSRCSSFYANNTQNKRTDVTHHSLMINNDPWH